MLKQLKVVTLVVSCLLPLQPLIAQDLSEARGEEARLWIATSDRLLGLGLDSGAVLFESASAEGVRSLAVDRQAGSLWILRAQRLDRIDLRASDHVEVVAAVSAQEPGGLLALVPSDSGARVVSENRAEEFSGTGELLESRAAFVESEQRGILDGAECVDPIEGNRLRTTPRSVWWDVQDPNASIPEVEIDGTRFAQCDSFGGAWVASSARVVRLNRFGEIAVDYAIPEDLGGIRAVRADTRDGALWLATRQVVFRLGLDGIVQRQFETELGEDIQALAFELVGGSGRDSARALAGRLGLHATPMAVLGANLAANELAFQGRVLFPDSRPVAGLEVVVFADSVARTTTAVDGTFLTPPAQYAGAGNDVLVLFQKTTAAGRIYGAARFGIAPGQTYDMGDFFVDFHCAADFASGEFPASALNGDVRSMVVFDNGSGAALYVAGTFTTAGGVTVNRVAKWNGTQWSALGSGLGGGTAPTVDALVVFDDGSGPKLYAGGKFTTSGTTSVKYVAKWTGAAWAQVGLGLANQVYALAVFNDGSGPRLFAGGSFTSANSITYNRLAKWSGSAWQAVSSGLNGVVRSLAVHDDGGGTKLYVGGLFTQAGGSIAAARIARWSGTAWSAVGTGVSGGTPIQVNALLPWDDGTGVKLYAGGRFTTASATTVNHIARWNGSAWSAVGTGLGTQVNALASFDDGTGSALYAAGSFTTISGTAFNRLARWNGGAWGRVGTGLNGNALADVPGSLPGKEPSLFVGGSFSSANGTTSTRVARLRRPLACTDLATPDLTFITPLEGSGQGSSTPELTFGFGDRGSGVQPGTIEVSQGGTNLSTSCTYTADTANCALLQPVTGGAVTLSATIRDLAGNTSWPVTRSFVVEDLVPPTLAITEPLEGATAAELRPTLRFTYGDAGSGVDTATLAVVVDASNVSVECQFGASSAACVPVTDLPAGAVTLSATIQDLQGNLSSAAVVHFTVNAAPTYSVTLTGTTRFEDGSPAGGARVEFLHTSSIYATSAADGSFALGPISLASLSPIDLAARVSISFKPYVGFLNDFLPPAAGTHAVGVIALKKRCGYGEVTTPWVATEATLAGSVMTAARFDAGAGPELVVAGDFNFTSQGTRAQIARWTNEGWADLGGGFNYAVQPVVRSLATFDDGTGEALYAGGLFYAASGKWIYNFAKWDGTSWSEVGLGTNDEVKSIARFDDGRGPALFLVGDFTAVRSSLDWTGVSQAIPASHLARWDGSQWSAVPAGPEEGFFAGPTHLFVAQEGAAELLYLYSEFESVIWRLGTAGWEAIATPAEFGLYQAVVFDDGSGPSLFVGGPGIGIQKRTGTTWVEVRPLALNGVTYPLAVFDDGTGAALYAVQRFEDLPGSPDADHVRRWNGSTWSGPLGDADSLLVTSGTGLQDLLKLAQTYYPSTTVVARWSAGAFADLRAAGDTTGSIRSVAFEEEGSGYWIFFAGPERAGGVELGGGIGRWDGSTVVAANQGLQGLGTKVVQVPEGTTTRVYAIVESTGEIAVWTGSSWTAVGQPLGVPIHTIAALDLGGGAQLYAAGEGVYRWNGAFWASLNGPSGVNAIEALNGLLYVGASGLAKWDGTSWSAVGTATAIGLDGPVYALRTLNGVLHIGGDFSRTRTGSLLHYSYVTWNGWAWGAGISGSCGFLGNRYLSSALPTPLVGSSLFALGLLDDRSTSASAAVIAGGEFASSCSSAGTGDELPYYNVNLGIGADGGPVLALAPATLFGAPAMVVGGGFGEWNGLPSARLGIWAVAPNWEECSTANQPPVITLIAPLVHTTTAATVAFSGSIDEPVALTINGSTVPVAADNTFASAPQTLHEGLNSFVLVATDWDGSTGRIQFDLVRDSLPPVISVSFPTEGASVTTAQPALDLTFSDSSSGVDPASLVVEINGAPLATSACVVRPAQARCTPSSPLPGGANAMAARIRDLAGNLSATVLRSFIVNAAPGGAETTLVGVVQRASGVAAAGARVRLLGSAGLDTFAAADGTFSLMVPALTSRAPLTVVAELDDPAGLLLGAASGLSPVLGGTTPTGTIVLGPACDPEFVSGFLTSQVDLNGRILALAVFDDGSGAALFAAGNNLLSQGGLDYDLVKWNGAKWIASPLGYMSGTAMGWIRALAVFDDGTGPALYAGGSFTSAGGVPASSLARWNGTAWSAVGGGVTAQFISPVSGLCVQATGTVNALIAATDAGGPALFVGGDFYLAGAVPADMVARWNGSSWSGAPVTGCAVATGRRVEALAMYDDGGGAALHAGGYFTSIAGTPARSVAKLNGQGWEALAQGVGRKDTSGVVLTGLISSMAVFDSGDGPELIVGGLFNRAGDGLGLASSVARWNGESWAPLGSGLETTFTSLTEPSGVQALAVFDDGSGPALFASGSLTGTSETQFHGIAKWDGNAWLPLGAGLSSPGTGGMAMVLFEGRLAVVGGFAAASGAAARGVARWGADGWSVFGSTLSGEVSALVLFDDGTGTALYAGGSFISTGSRVLNRIARWSGTAWEPVGAGFNGDVRALAVFNDAGAPALFAGGAFTLSGSTAMSGLASWNGAAWSAVGGGVMNGGAAGVVEALAIYTDAGGPALFAGGTFTLAGGLSANRVARWSGSAWSALGSGLDNSVYALTGASVGGTSGLFVGGAFTTAGGATANRVARWNGSAWSALGTGANGTVLSLQAWPPDTGTQLLAGGSFTTAGGVSASRLASWSGTVWAAVTGGSPNNTIETLLGRQEGSTNRIVAGGAFTQVGTTTAGRIADWNGTAWTPLGTGAASGSVLALLEQDEPAGRSLWLGGSFTTVGGLDSPYIAKWKRPLTCGDTSPPVVNITTPAEGALLTTSLPALTVTHTDSMSSVDLATLQWTVNGAAAATTCNSTAGESTCDLALPLVDGPATLQASVRDLAGNLGTSSTISVTVDTLPPSVSFTSPANGAILTASPAGVVVVYSDSATAIVTSSFLFSGSGPASAQWSCPLDDSSATCIPTAALADGAWSVTASIADAAGHRGEATTGFIVDTQPPALTISVPQNGAYLNDRTPTLEVSYADAGSGIDPQTLAWLANGIPFNTSCQFSSGSAICEPLSELPLGGVEISATVRDLAQRVSPPAQVSVTISLDFTPPVLTITSPANGAVTQAGQVVISGSIDEAGSVTINGTGATLNAQNEFSFGPVDLAQGWNRFTVTAADLVGNQALEIVRVLRDDTVPRLSFVTPVDGSFFDAQSAQIELLVGDLGSGANPQSIEVEANGVPVAVSCQSCPPWLRCYVPATAGPVVTLRATIADFALNRSAATTTRYTDTEGTDIVPPVIQLQSPVSGSRTTDPSLYFVGSLSEPAALTLNGAAVQVQPDLSFVHEPAQLTEGSNAFLLHAQDASGNSSELAVNVTLDRVAPLPVVPALVTVGAPAASSSLVSGAPGAAPETGTAYRLRCRNLGSGAVLEVPISSSGSFSAALGAEGGDRISLMVLDDVGNASDVRIFTVPGGRILPPDPALVAPVLDFTEAPAPCKQFEFLFDPSFSIQRGVTVGFPECRRQALVRGRVLTRGGDPAPGIRVSMPREAGLGYTLTRADGRFDLVVHGGGETLLHFDSPDFLPVERQVRIGWGETRGLDDVRLVTREPLTSAVDLAAALPIQVARGSAVTDADGSRQATLLFPQGTTATLRFPEGQAARVTSLTVRATEYTVGVDGIRAMPAPLPQASAYTYAVELEASEVEAAGASAVSFSQPVPVHLENFLGLPVGTVVPAGYYDRERHAWVPEANGVVLKILSIQGGAPPFAELDLDGSGQPASAEALTAAGISLAERESLATLYAAGQELWRVPVTHFSPYDFNLAWAGSGDVRPPKNGPAKGADEDKKDDPCPGAGSIIECENQILGEVLPLVGTPLTLHYASDRVPGRKAAFRLDVPLAPAGISPDLRRIEVQVDVAGQQVRQSFVPGPNQKFSFDWDGLDSYGRQLQGRQLFEAHVGYVYDADYSQAPPGCTLCFGAQGVAPIVGNPAREEVTFFQSSSGRIGSWNALEAFQLGGWSLSAHHVYDANDGMLYLGTGERRKPKDMKVITTMVGTGVAGDEGEGGPAPEATISSPGAVALDPRGSGGFYFVDAGNCQIRRVDSFGRIWRVAGTRCSGILEPPPILNGIQALDATLQNNTSLAVDADGLVYFTEGPANVIRRIGRDGKIWTIAGFPTNPGSHGPGSTPATQVHFVHPAALALGPDGALYFGAGDSLFGSSIYRLDLVSGEYDLVAGDGQDDCGFGTFSQGSARALFISGEVSQIRFDEDGTMYFLVFGIYHESDPRPAVNALVAVRPDGSALRIAGGCVIAGSCPGEGWYCHGYTGDGGPAELALIDGATGLELAPDGSLLLVDAFNHVVRKIENGVIRTVAGFGSAGYNGMGRPATATQLNWPFGIALYPDGDVLVTDRGNNRIRRLEDVLPESQPVVSQVILIPAEDGRSRYVFDSTGRHLRTEDTQTGQVLLTFGYNAEGQLTSIADAFSNVTTVQRNTQGTATAIVAPFGQRTLLTQDANGYLSGVENPASERFAMTYTPDGLMMSFESPRGFASTFFWDELGRLEKDVDALGGFSQLGRTDTDSAYTVTKSSAMGRTATFLTEKLSTGETQTTITAPDGTTSVSLKSPSGARISTSADGTVATAKEAPDPRFGMQAPTLSDLTVASPGGLVSTTALSRSVTLVNPAGDPADPANVASIFDSVNVNGRTATSLYMSGARTLTTTSPLGRKGTTTFDLFGRVSEALSPGVAPVSSAYDAQGRLSTVTQGTRQTIYTYNAEGLLWKIRDPLAREVQFTYNSAGRVVAQQLPDNRIVQFDYDANGNLTSLTPPGRPQHGFGYDGVDQGTEYNPPEAGLPEDRTLFTYNLDHQLELVTRPDLQTIDSVYDAATGRLTSMVTPRGSYLYSYQPGDGNLASVADPDGGSLALTYDGSLPKSVTWTGPVAGSLQLGYNNSFELTSRKVNDANEITFGYDLDGLLTQAGALTLSRDAATGFLSGTSMPGASDLYTYTGFGELDTYSARHGAADLYSFDTARDDGGRITTKSETVEGVTHSWEYLYDTAGRLDQVKRDSAVVADYDYDTNSNRTAWTDGWGSGAATYDDQDRLLTYGSKSYTYTANGELATKTDGTDFTTYSYDVMGNLRTVGLPTGITIDYVIDAANRRVGKKVNGTLVQGFLYQSQLAPAAELDGAGNVTSLFVYATKGNVPDYMVKAGETYRLFTDHLGSVRLVVNATTGAVAQRIDYDTFGRPQLDTNPGFQPFGFAGGVYDTQTGLTRFGARDYDTETGRWVEKDPIGFAGGDSNLYGYVVNDPVNLTDPNGKIIPLLAAAWAIVEAGLSIYDVYDAYATATDPCASLSDQGLSAGGLFAGMLLPGGGYGAAAKQVSRAAAEMHHLLPQAKRFRGYFDAAGLDIEDFKVPLDRATHRLRPGGVHTKNGGDWNGVWDSFFEVNPQATQQQILDQLGQMRREFGI